MTKQKTGDALGDLKALPTEIVTEAATYLPVMENEEEVAEAYIDLADALDAGGMEAIRYGDHGPLVTIEGQTYEVVLRKVVA